MISLPPVAVFRDSRPHGIRALEAGACARLSPFTAQLRADPATLTLLSIIATNDPDGAGDVIEPDGLRNRDEYLRSPVVLWAHNPLLSGSSEPRKYELTRSYVTFPPAFQRGRGVGSLKVAAS